ncbi:MAG: SusC/RagA family TonB-linked outer membrane protein, partial [Sphingobacteriaceae bacterium]|nr:SusC/RagA family TonB-linked outer membrane protein [Cytophagaceae bacterium]
MKKRVYNSHFLYQAMRFTVVQVTLVLLLGSVAFARRGNAQELLNQKITLRVENERMRSVLALIEKAAQVNFMFQAKVLGENPRLSVAANNQTLGDLLNELLLPRRLRYEVIGRQIVLSRQATSGADQNLALPDLDGVEMTVPETTLTGRISDENGTPVPGATVRLKDTNFGSSSNASGEYSLRVSDEAARTGTLVVSSVGYVTQEVALGGRTRIDVSLRVLVGSLNEVVVVGYGTQQKRDLTGSISQVKSEDIKSLPVTGLDQAIQGRAAGVQITQNNAEPGGSVSIRIRGVGTINGSEPLVVVDGLPMSGSINSINPNDVESIEILKDASAAAIYGSRAANGVVLVTTRRGKSGQTKVEIDAYYGVQAPSRKIDVLNGPEFATLANEAYINSKERLNPLWANPASLPSYDWQDAIFQNSPVYSLNMTVSGGTDKSRTAVSVNYFRQDGVIVNSKYDRYSIRMNNDFEISKKIRFGTNLYLARDNGRYTPTNDFSFGVLQTAYQMQPFQPIYAPDGPQSATVFGLDGFAHFPLTTDGLYYPRQLANPVWGTSSAVRNDIRKLTRLFGTVFGEVDILEGLKFRTSIGGDLSFNQSDGFSPQVKANIFGANTNDIQVSQGRSENGSWNWINTLAYSRTLAERHALTALIGVDALKGQNSGINADARSFPNNDVTAIGLAQTRTAGGGQSQYALFSYLGRLTYAYNSRYLFSFNV